MESKTKFYMAFSHAHMFATCLIMSQLRYQFTGRNMPLPKIKRGGHFGGLTGMWVFQSITLYRTTNSAKSQAKIRFAFHFVERKDRILTFFKYYLDPGPCIFKHSFLLKLLTCNILVNKRKFARLITQYRDIFFPIFRMARPSFFRVLHRINQPEEGRPCLPKYWKK